MKTCNKCNIQKEDVDFYKINNKVQNRCRICVRSTYKATYPARREEIVKANAKRRENLHKLVNEIKNTPCTDCGKSYPHYCMDFDHLGDKIMAVAHMVHNNYSFDKIKAEIAKCELVCALCHRDRTYKRMIGSTSKDVFKCIKRNRKIIEENKSKPCERCHIQYDTWLMDYDHINPENKLYCVGEMLARSDKKLLAEIAKCQVLCAICHRLKTKETRDAQKNSSQSETIS